MNPLGNRARADELARLLEGAVAGPAASTAGMASLAVRLRALSPALDDVVALRPDFRDSLRQRLVAVATVQGPHLSDVPAGPQPAGALERAVSWSRTWSAQKRIAAVSAAMAAVVAITGVGAAASHSLPGQPFYSLKRSSEALQLNLADGDTAKGTKHLEFAATRLREVRALVRGDGQLALGAVQGSGNLAAGRASGSLQQRINETLAEFDSQTTKGKKLLERVYRSTGKTAPLRVLATFATQQEERLTSLIPELPPGTANAAQESLALVVSVGTTASELLVIGTCGAECDPSTGGPELPVEPGPTPGTSASPDGNNEVPPCECGEPSLAPEPTTEPTSSASPEPTSSPSPTPTTTPSPTTSPTPGGLLPLPLPTILPTDLPTLPSLPPLPLPLPPLPTELPLVPSALPEGVVRP